VFTVLDYPDLDHQLEPLLDAPHWYVGFSGGVDSSALLHLLRCWCQAHSGAPPLTAIHVNHQLQESADDWQTHCEWLCRVLQIPIISLRTRVEPGPRGLEAAAREARYRLFEQHLRPGDVLFLGHHADDQVETFFLRLLRGAGVRGLASMPAERRLGQGRLARPLLRLPRATLESYVAAHGLSCIEDPSNGDTSLDRNFLRGELLPLLASRWPGYRQTVTRASEHIAGAAALLAQAVPAPDTVYSAMGDPGLRLSELCDPPQEQAALALRHWLQAGGLPPPDQAALAEFLRQLREDLSEQAKPRLECSAYCLQRYRDAVYLLPDFAGQQAPWSCGLAPGEIVQLPGPAGRLRLQPATGDGLALASSQQLEVRARLGGERCRVRGRAGRAGLKKLLQEAGVPPWWRDWVPLLYLDGELLAVGDLWLCQSSRWAATDDAPESLWQPCWQRNITAAFD